MKTKTNGQTPKPVFAKLTPEMSREQKFKNLKAALIKSGFKIKDDVRPK